MNHYLDGPHEVIIVLRSKKTGTESVIRLPSSALVELGIENEYHPEDPFSMFDEPRVAYERTTHLTLNVSTRDTIAYVPDTSLLPKDKKDRITWP